MRNTLMAAAALGGRVELAAGFGWTARHAWYALTHDPRLWAVMPHVDRRSGWPIAGADD